MGSDKKQLEKIIQEFNDGSYTDEVLQSYMDELYETEVVTGVKDSLIMLKIFDYLDKKLQDEIRAKLKN